MKKGVIVSIFLIFLGSIFECLHLITDYRFFEIKFWILGIGLMIAGVLGLFWFTVVPILEDRAEKLGKFKKNQKKKK